MPRLAPVTSAVFCIATEPGARRKDPQVGSRVKLKNPQLYAHTGSEVKHDDEYVLSGLLGVCPSRRVVSDATSAVIVA
jgi:hypothetical protein